MHSLGGMARAHSAAGLATTQDRQVRTSCDSAPLHATTLVFAQGVLQAQSCTQLLSTAKRKDAPLACPSPCVKAGACKCVVSPA